jgi:hypothetical protein
MTAQLVHHGEAVNGRLRRMVQNMDPDESAKEAV